MDNRYLVILEVSQKQAYIFSSNDLKVIIENSKNIAWVTDWNFLKSVINDNNKLNENNRVYEGGGHVIMQFEDRQKAQAVIAAITERILIAYPKMEVFAKIMKYQDDKIPAENVKCLIEKLEEKKAIRKSSFHQGTFGIEKIDSNTLDEIQVEVNKEVLPKNYQEENLPEGFCKTYKFEDLGGSKDESNFIAVVHIDGNGMGNRVDTFGEKIVSWEEYRHSMRAFSEGIDNDFKEAYRQMCEEIGDAITSKDSSIATALNLRKDENGKIYFPVRRIVSSGDDICFVAEGRIGIEAAVSFIRKITEIPNLIDGKSYGVCAGVSIIHKNYPFYRAYKLAEELCKNAKKFGAGLSAEDNGENVSSIDWHIEYGEIRDTVKETREDYRTYDSIINEKGIYKCRRLELRPYIVKASSQVMEREPIRQYDNFYNFMKKIQSEKYGAGIIKSLRGELKKGLAATDYYLRFHQVTDLGRELFHGIYQESDYSRVGKGEKSQYVIFVKTSDGEERSVMFDGIELMDTYLRLKED